MAKRKIVLEWLREAEEDYRFAAVNLKDQDRFFSRICFHFQQAAEKYLKAYIIAYNLGLEKIHNLNVLLDICIKANADFERLKEDCLFLNVFYIDTRYPAFWPVGNNRDEAKKAKKAVENIGKLVKNKLQLDKNIRIE